MLSGEALQSVSGWRAALLASALDAIIVMDSQGIIREFNDAASQTFGYAPEQTVGRTVAETIVPPEFREAHKRGLSRYLQTGEHRILNQRVEIEGQRSDGSTFPVELTIVPFNADGQTLFAGYLRDLSSKRQAEAEIHRANEVAILLRKIPLAASQADSFEAAAQVALDQVCRFAGWPLGNCYVRDESRDVLEPRGIWYIEDAQRFAGFRQVTDRTELAMGEGLPGRAWEQDRSVWVPDVHLDPGFTRARQTLDLGVRAGFAVPIPVGGRTEAVLEFYSPDAKEPDLHLLDVTQALVRDLGGVLERQRSREQLRHANEQLSAMAARRADFLNLAAHELKNPLTPLSLQLQLLRRLGTMNEKQAQSLEIIDRSVARLKQIVQDLLEGARAQSGTLAIERVWTDLAALAEEAIRTFAHAAQEKGIVLRLRKTGPTRSYVDPQRAAQVLDNLVSNALKFTPEKGEIEIRIGRDGDWSILEVEDNGAGIAHADQGLLFQPFSQVHADLEHGGTGLGLYVCQAIMEAHGGRMGVESRGEGTGSRFWARWPLPRPSE